jgi:hypothetical protein
MDTFPQVIFIKSYIVNKKVSCGVRDKIKGNQLSLSSMDVVKGEIKENQLSLSSMDVVKVD